LPRVQSPSPQNALIDIGGLFYARGWSVGTCSNYSIVTSRDPLQLCITASGKDKRSLTEHDFVTVDGAGKPVGSTNKPSAETLLHTTLARVAGAGAILHTHSVWGTLLSDLDHPAGQTVIEGYEMLKGLSGVGTHETRYALTIFPNTQDIEALSVDLEKRLRDESRPIRHGFLLRNHGLYAWGNDLAEARRHIEIFEFLFEVVVRRRMITLIR
jgi:methylthioribulose-1-phosphate dehydratase